MSTVVYQSVSGSVWHWRDDARWWPASACNAANLRKSTAQPPEMVPVDERCGAKGCQVQWRALDAQWGAR